MAKRQIPTGKIVRKVVPVKRVITLQQGGLVSGKPNTPNSLPSRPTGKKVGVKRIYYG